MAAIDDGLLSALVPLNGLTPAQRSDVAETAELIELRAGETIATTSGAVNSTLYVISGALDLLSGESVIETVAAGTDRARFALAHFAILHDTGRAKVDTSLVRIDRARVSTLLILAQTPSGRAGDRTVIVPAGSWSARLMRSELFSRIPAANIQRIFDMMQSQSHPDGGVVVRQGDPGDYYYVVQEGTCDVSLEREGEAPIQVAQLGPGDAFGEEALVSGVRRNATVTMSSAGTLMHMTKEDFIELIHDPVLSRVNRTQADDLVARGAKWLDVRLADEHGADGIAGSLNIPLGEIRPGFESLDLAQSYVVYCNSGRRSAAAAFLIAERGISASMLAGGLFGDGPRSEPDTAAPQMRDLERRLMLANAAFESALRHKAQTDAAKAVAVSSEASREGANAPAELAELAAQPVQLERDSELASEALAAAQGSKLELEAEMRKAEAEAAAARAQAEATIERLRAEAETRLQDEEARLKNEYAEAAAEMKRLDESRREAQRRFEADRRRLEEQFARERNAMESEAERIRGGVENAKRDAEQKVEAIRGEHLESERKLREETEARLRAERKRLESEFAMSVAAQEKARQDLELAEAAKRLAQAEAARLATEIEASEQRRRTEEQATRDQQRERLEQERELADEQLDAARKQQEDLSSTIVRIRQGVRPDPAPADDREEQLRSELAEFEGQLAAADEQVDAAERAKSVAERAQQQADVQLAHQRAAEDELRLKLYDEVEDWLGEERKESDAELERLRNLEAGLERIQSEKAEATQQAKVAAADLMADVSSQLGDDESRRTIAEHHALLTRDAQDELAAEKARVREALAKARQQLEALQSA